MRAHAWRQRRSVWRGHFPQCKRMAARYLGIYIYRSVVVWVKALPHYQLVVVWVKALPHYQLSKPNPVAGINGHHELQNTEEMKTIMLCKPLTVLYWSFVPESVQDPAAVLCSSHQFPCPKLGYNTYRTVKHFTLNPTTITSGASVNCCRCQLIYSEIIVQLHAVIAMN